MRRRALPGPIARPTFPSAVSDASPLAAHSELLASQFPHRERGIFLNSAAQGILARRTIEAMHEFESDRAYPPAIDDPRLLEVETTCRARVGRLLGAPPELVGLCVNTSEGINVAALHLPLESGQRVLVARGEFPANVYPWLGLARKGVETVFLELDGAHLSAERVAEALDADPAIRAVSMSLVQFSNGQRNPVEAVGRVCREHGVECTVCIDVANRSRQMHASGASVRAIRAAIDKEFGAQFPAGRNMHTPHPPSTH